MTTVAASQIKDISLAPAGHQKIAWVSAHMPLVQQLRKQFEADKPFAGKRISVCMHLEAKTAYLVLAIQAAGAEVAVAASNPLSTQDDVVAALVDSGVRAYAWRGESTADYNEHLERLLDFHPHLVIDDGGDLVTLLHRDRPQQIAEIIGGCEETTTGVTRLQAMAAEGKLEFPMMAVNDAYCKHLFDNRYGSGQSVWDGIMRTTNLVVAGKTAVVIGYGWCGRGVAMRAKGLGARVVICEVDPIRALEAVMDGYEVMPVREAAKVGDFFITVTGNRDCLTAESLQVMKDGAILANAGHFDVEINIPELRSLAVSVQEVRNNIQEFKLGDGRRLYLLAEGRLVNLASGDGHPTEVMDMSFALQALALQELVTKRYDKGVHTMPVELDKHVASMRLAAWGIAIDTLTPAQARYVTSWQHA